MRAVARRRMSELFSRGWWKFYSAGLRIQIYLRSLDATLTPYSPEKKYLKSLCCQAPVLQKYNCMMDIFLLKCSLCNQVLAIELREERYARDGDDLIPPNYAWDFSGSLEREVY